MDSKSLKNTGANLFQIRETAAETGVKADPASGVKKAPLLFAGASFDPAKRFTPMTTGPSVVSTMVSAMRHETLVPKELAGIGVVCAPDTSKNPAVELFHHLRAGQPYIFAPNTQPDRLVAAACKAAKAFKDSPTEGPVRVFAWSSANGWLEVYPEDGRPVARDKEGKVLPFDKVGDTARTDYNDKRLATELYGPQQAGMVLDFLNPVESLRALSRFDMGKSDAGPGRAVFVMNGMGPHLKNSLQDDGRLIQQLKDMRSGLTGQNGQSHIVFNDTPALQPEAARELGTTFKMTLPGREGMEAQLFANLTNFLFTRVPADAQQRAPEAVGDAEVAAWRAVAGDNVKPEAIKSAIADGITLEAFKAFLPEGKAMPAVAEQLIGFTFEQAKDLAGEAISRGADAGKIDFDFIIKRRFDMLKGTYGIELVKADKNLPSPQGLDRVIADMKVLRNTFDFGHLLEKPIGLPPLILLAGVPGMGKSLIAKHTAEELGKPLIKLDLAKLFNKFVGESEANFARMFEILESLAPCVVWVDEIEKALGGTAEGSSSTDGGVTNRVHGLFLTWLEERKERILMIGTCNDPLQLSSALVNRAPVKYFVGYADPEALADIWKSNLKALAQSHTLTDAQIGELVKQKPSLSGREVAQRVLQARMAALPRTVQNGNKEVLTFEDLQAALQGYRTDFDKAPHRARAIIALSEAYESASGRAIFLPPEGDAAPAAPQPAAAAGADGKAEPQRRAGARPAFDQV